MTHASIVRLFFASANVDAYRRLGITVTDAGFAVGHVAVEFEPGTTPGLVAVGIQGATRLPDAAEAGATFRHAAPADRATPHAFPLVRLDHLASVAPDFDERTRYWVETLGVPLAGEVVAPTMFVRQFRLGDAIYELIAANGPDSPLHKRPAGLVSLASWEVADLDAVVAQARAAGFSPSEPAVGVLPGTRTATIPATELGGVAMQLLEKGDASIYRRPQIDASPFSSASPKPVPP